MNEPVASPDESRDLRARFGELLEAVEAAYERRPSPPSPLSPLAAEVREALLQIPSPPGVPFDGVARSAPPVRRLAKGDRLGDYEIVRAIGAGGMGEVFEATRRALGLRVALKTLRDPAGATDEAFLRFRREAMLLAKLDDPRVCKVYDVGLHEGRAYFAMEYVDGRTFSAAISALYADADADSWHASMSSDSDIPAPAAPPPGAPRNNPPRLEALTPLVLALAEAARGLAAAHRLGIVHRDLKPGNLMLRADGRPVVLDFGLAVDVRDSVGGRFTEAGDRHGTTVYMAPEQVSGGGRDADARLDVYGLGLVLYEILCGRRPFERESRAATYDAIRRGDPPDPRTANRYVTRDLAGVCLKALETDPARRYPTADAFAEDLLRAAQGLSVSTRPMSRLERLRRSAARRPRVAALAIVALLSAAGFGGYAAFESARRANRGAAGPAIRGVADAVARGDAPAAADLAALSFLPAEDRERLLALLQAPPEKAHEKALDLLAAVALRGPADLPVALRSPRGAVFGLRPTFVVDLRGLAVVEDVDVAKLRVRVFDAASRLVASLPLDATDPAAASATPSADVVFKADVPYRFDVALVDAPPPSADVGAAFILRDAPAPTPPTDPVARCVAAERLLAEGAVATAAAWCSAPFGGPADVERRRLAVLVAARLRLYDPTAAVAVLDGVRGAR